MASLAAHKINHAQAAAIGVQELDTIQLMLANGEPMKRTIDGDVAKRGRAQIQLSVRAQVFESHVIETGM